MKPFLNKIALTFLLLSVVLPPPVFAAEQEENRKIIVYQEEATEDNLLESIEEVGGKVERTYENRSMATAELTEAEEKELLKNPLVKDIEDDVILTLNAQQLDWGISHLQMYRAWDSGFSGRGVKVAVIDSGISPHKDLRIAGGISTVAYTQSYWDDQGHGTHVAGVISALDNNIGVKGVAHGAEIYSVKSFDSTGAAYLSEFIDGIYWSIDAGMDIINISASSPLHSDALRTAVNAAYAKDILVVSAAGNDGKLDGSGDTVEYPARYASVIAVAALDRDSTRAFFSGSGPAVEVTAPGMRINSTYLNNQYLHMSGSSMAAPYVTGLLAVMKEAYPSMSNAELRAEMIRNAKDLGAPGRDPLFGYGLIQAASSKNGEQPAFPFKFTDVSSSYYKAVNYLFQKGVTTGKTETTFGVSEHIIRADAAVWLAKELELDTVSAPPSGFTDVPRRAEGAVNALKHAGIVGGKTNVNFASYDLLTRGEIALILHRAYELSPNGTNSTFSDVSLRYQEAVDSLVANEVTKGVSIDRFGIVNHIKRGDLAIFLYRLADTP